jgi:ElaA protein
MTFDFRLSSFDDLSLRELYAIGRLRQEVFVVEQNCPYIDFDGRDDQCYHLMFWDAEGELVAYARLVPKGLSYPDEPSIGRVITSQKARGTGLGRRLMLAAVAECFRLWGESTIRISAQTYLLSFYSALGFVSTGKEYLEDDIPHTEMLFSITV